MARPLSLVREVEAVPSSLAASPRPRWSLVLVAGLVVWTVAILSLDTGHFGMFQDDGLYLSAARSLRDGHGYGLPGRPGEPPPKYPIGLPAVLALVLRLDPGPPSLAREVAAARVLVAVSGWAFFLAAHAWLGRLRVGPGWACLIVLATAFEYVIAVQTAITLMADLPFAAVTFVLLARWAGRRPTTGGAAGPRPLRPSLVDGALAGFAVVLRSNGVTLVAAGVIAALVGASGRRGRGRWDWSAAGACLLAAALVAAPATWYAGRHPRVVASNSYAVELGAGWTSPTAGLQIVARNLTAALGWFPTRVLAVPLSQDDAMVRRFDRHPALAWSIRSVFSGVVLVGVIALARASRRRDWPVWTHVAGTVAIFAIWPWTSILDRFLLTLIPPVLLAFAVGLARLARRIPDLRADLGARRRVVGAGLGVVLACNVAVVTQAVRYHNGHAGQWLGFPDRVDLDRMFAAIRDRTAPDAVIAAFWPEMVYLQTDRTAVPLIEDEAVMLNRFGDATRVRQWRDLAAGRPFYLLHRSLREDPDGVDVLQVAALLAPRSGSPRLFAETVAATPDGAYTLSRLVEPGADRISRVPDAARPTSR